MSLLPDKPWKPSEPSDKVFVALVEKNVREADEFVKEYHHEWLMQDNTAARAHPSRKKQIGACNECGGDYDKVTVGCRKCKLRHYMRRLRQRSVESVEQTQ